MKFFIVWEQYSEQWILTAKGHKFLDVTNPSDIDKALHEFLEHLAIEQGIDPKFLVAVRCESIPSVHKKQSEPLLQVTASGNNEADPLFDEVVAFVVKNRRASIAAIQRQFKIGYNRAARFIEQMEADGIVSEPGHNGNREVLS
ncbi:hypothetical protein JK223_00835 [Tatumella sp. JGM118]|nr:hypothetical protein [Tatumella sp. JGM118]